LIDALQRDVMELAGTIGERNVNQPRAYAVAASFIERSFASAGYVPQRQNFDAEGVTCANIEAEVHGGNEIVVIGAHYDSVIGTAGADDNASGVAAILAMARAFVGSKPRRTLRFVAFANEEPPWFGTDLMGSYRYARRCRARGERVIGMLSLETIAYFSDARGSQRYPAMLEVLYPTQANFIAFASNLPSWLLLRRCLSRFRKHATIPAEGAALPEQVPGIGWSDQWAFWRFGYRAVMVTDTALFRNPNYHTSADTPETLDYERFARVVDGLTQVVEDLVNGK
jgi:Zn-dependent M28 family amino/carboxypeptidase